MTNHNPSSGSSAAACRAKEAVRTAAAATGNDASVNIPIGDDIHLSELVRSLRSLASDSPERQAKLEELARMYAAGTYRVNAAATAAKIVEDALEK